MRRRIRLIILIGVIVVVFTIGYFLTSWLGKKELLWEEVGVFKAKQEAKIENVCQLPKRLERPSITPLVREEKRVEVK
ncbi:MAG: hypothetical protein AOA65_2043 [Candidatus Bathyarchaeota archaeon BA1]|nr:MAG: hypothetical protein AOA65_2043 [Candidatus Bathyarchaeota archaeon BA1]